MSSQELIFQAFVFQLIQLFKKPVKHVAAPQIGDNGNPVNLAVPGQADFRYLGNQLGGHIVHAVKANIFQGVHCPGFSRAG